MKRLFFALWPDENIRQQCEKIRNEVLTEQAQPVRAYNFHVTLLFLGNIDSDKEEGLKQEFAALQVPNMTLRFDRISFWSKPGIICLTATFPNPEIESFVETLSKLARELGIPTDDRPFKPHVTLVKNVKTQTRLEFDPIIWHSSSFCLVESSRLPNGINYRIVEEWEAH